MLYETLYTFADHYLRLLCVNFGRAALGSRIEKRDDVFPLIYYLHWATEREQGGKRKKKKVRVRVVCLRLARRCQE